MYLAKVKREIEEDMTREMQDNRLSGALDMDSPVKPNGEEEGNGESGEDELDGKHQDFDPDELPDGACISPQRLTVTVPGQRTNSTAVRPAKYIGSFSVLGEDQNSRAEYVRKQLAQMRDVTRSKPVLLVISLSGIKVCSSNGESVYMAHALKRISYATCDPEYCQFSFLAREPKGDTSRQYCHAFITQSPEEAEELNTIVANAFKLAYSAQRRTETSEPKPDTPTFNQLIQQQIDAQQSRFEEIQAANQRALEEKLHAISTPTVDQRVRERKERRRKEQEELEQAREMSRLIGKERMSWAKHIVGRTRHKLPFSDEDAVMSSPGQTSGVDPASFESAAALSLRHALDTHDMRTHGSPVMALKETIDNHFNGQLNHVGLESSMSQEAETYLYPTNHGSENSPRSEEIGNRPLPATPSSDDKNKKKAKKDRKTSPKGDKSKEGRKSWILGNSKGDKCDGIASVRSSLNGHKISRPLSARYQNDGTLQYRNDMDQVDSDLYAGPPTPKRVSQPSTIYKNKHTGRYDSLRRPDASWPPLEEEDPSLKQSVWYQAGTPREVALDILSQQDIGYFIVRDSTTHPGCYALSVKVPKFENQTGISHYLIQRTEKGGVKLKGLDKEWPTLMALVTHHTVMREMLPCTLRLPRHARNPAFNDTDNDDTDDKDTDEDYQKLSDFSSMMADLKM